MATQLQMRRGTQNEHNSFTGAVGEVTINTTEDSLRIHDGSKVGGHSITLQSIARSLNVQDSEVIYSDDTVTVLNNVLYIYDASTQTTWGKPAGVGAGETITNVTGSALTTTGGSYTLVTKEKSDLRMSKSEAIASTDLKIGDSVRITDRGDSIFDVTSAGSVDGYSVLQGAVYKLTLRTGGIVTVASFGAKADPGFDNTEYINAALDFTRDRGVVTSSDINEYEIYGRVNVVNKTLRNIALRFMSGSSLVVGGYGKLKSLDCDVAAARPAFSTALSGVINLHLADGSVIDDVSIPNGNSNEIGIFCSTRASNVVIKNCDIPNIGWPILFNDTVVRGSRTVDAVDYSDAAIGKNLIIKNCELGAPTKTAVGDGLEINCPEYRFENLIIDGVDIFKTNSTAAANGLGVGFANIDNATIVGCFLSDIPVTAGAIHAEKSVNVSVLSNTIVNSEMGIGIGIDGENTLINGNILSDNTNGMQLLGSADYLKNTNISNNIIAKTDTFPLVVSQYKGLLVSNNFIVDIIGTGNGNYQYLNIQGGTLGSTKANIQSNTFTNDTGLTYPVLGKSGTLTETLSSGNVFDGTDGATFTSDVAGIGASFDHLRIGVDSSGKMITVTQNPNGWVTGTAGDYALDINNGQFYRHDGATWVAV